ncbi:MAG: transposase [Fimbriimonadaceae bacterium]|nr:hypothetical protein [Chthonomonadaceae bacterium]MCO5297436.1 transposase [Fimbriimonadaceae bacterium]
MAQEFEQFEPNERLTEEEVQAIVKRYGERQSGEGTGPTVADVAETLGVDSETVGRMLREIRGARTEQQLQERLNRLEAENEALRRRAEDGLEGSFFSSRHWMMRRARRRGRAGILAAAIAAAFVAAGGPKGAFEFGLAGPVVLLAVGALFLWRVFRD